MDQVKLIIERESFWATPKGDDRYEISNHLASVPLLCGDVVIAKPDQDGRLRVFDILQLQDQSHVLVHSGDLPRVTRDLERLDLTIEQLDDETLIAGIDAYPTEVRAVFLALYGHTDELFEVFDPMERVLETLRIIEKQ